jgi:hypothetical protein
VDTEDRNRLVVLGELVDQIADSSGSLARRGKSRLIAPELALQLAMRTWLIN